MIVCRWHHLEARCRERGYTLDQVRACVVSEDGDTITVDETHKAFPRERDLAGGSGLTLAAKAANFARAAGRHIAGGMQLASDDAIASRFAICQQCEQYDGTACRQCGCPVVRERRFISKLSWASESCPIGNWGPAAATQQPAT